MSTLLGITFRGVERTDAIEQYVRTRAAKLEMFERHIVRYHVTIETPHRHKRHGYHHRVRIDIALPGAELVVARDPADHRDREDLYASIDAAFDHARRVVSDHLGARLPRPRERSLHM